MPEILNQNNVPTLTNLVAAGNPRKKATKKNSNSSQLDELNQRIDEIENAIGQDNVSPVGRAHAIRAESNKFNRKDTSIKKDTETQ